MLTREQAQAYLDEFYPGGIVNKVTGTHVHISEIIQNAINCSIVYPPEIAAPRTRQFPEPHRYDHLVAMSKLEDV